ncbi:hypothetical protein RJ55_05725 [Drechmeria coniospora]|nr:hypothetical protein RJ55_05725 [Drechmeria coniospora]
MPLVQTSSRQRLRASTTAKIGLNDAVPNEVLTYLQSIPSLDAANASLGDSVVEQGERSSKRRKVSTNATPPVSVAKADIAFSRPCREDAPTSFTRTIHGTSSNLRLRLEPDGSFCMEAAPSSSRHLFSASISLQPHDASETARRILDVSGHSRDQSSPGAIWTAATLVVNRDGPVVSMLISLELFWNETQSPLLPLRSRAERKLSQKLIDVFFPITPPARDFAGWSPMDFYDAAYVPPKDDHDSQTIRVPELEATLFPYQKRTLCWLLAREGMQWSASESQPRPLPRNDVEPQVNAFRSLTDSNGDPVFVSDLFQTVTRDTILYRQADTSVRGGILAEEMGLGKTLEILSLILLNRHPGPSTQEEARSGTHLTSTRATLIVTPESLRPQWMSEISRHAPHLRVKHYQGCKRLKNINQDFVVKELSDFDVVITTYSVLSAELHFALEPPKRARRYERAYDRPLSPLVKILWWRLCLDEAQMIENGYSQASVVARVLPRVNAWGITGTPVKDNVNDLAGLLSFLQYQPYCSASHIWQSLIKDHKPLFQQIFKSISLRHTKALVRDEIMLPPQNRYVISMPFTAVEEQHYQTLFKDMAEECDLDLDGAPLLGDWEPSKYEDAMRRWLNRLRQATLHPDVGVYSRRLLGSSKYRPMRTVDEVLSAMLDQSDNTIRHTERAYQLSRLHRGQLLENSPRVKEARAIWEEVRVDTEKLVGLARKTLEDALREHGSENAARKATKAGSSEDAAELDESDTEWEGENNGELNEHRRRLRSALELHHKAVFFCANAYFQIKENAEMTEPDSEEYHRLKKLEDDGYEQAKVIRREILRESNGKATRVMEKIARKASNQSFTQIPELLINSDRGIESGGILDGLETLYRELNEQANVLDEWREEVVQLLLQPLVDEDDGIETTGEELTESAKFQDLLMVYYQTLRAAIADRQDAISGGTNELVKHETETSRKLAMDGGGPAPEKLLEMLKKRGEIRPGLNGSSMRGAVCDFRGLLTRLGRDLSGTSREVIESRMATSQLAATQAQLIKQSKVAVALESEIERFKTVMNTRLEYYRQLQAVSDEVMPSEDPKTEVAIERAWQAELDLRQKLSSAEAKHRYLLNLKEQGSKSNEPRMCVICQMPFVTGVLTVCGHQFCKECITLWFKAHHNCPVCKRVLKPSNLHDITIKPQQLQVRSEDAGCAGNVQGTQSASRRQGIAATHNTAIYSAFNSEKLAEIQDMDLNGPSFTTKVDTLLRHLLWLRLSDPGAKSIVFSQYKEFLTVLRNAFQRFRIGHASIDQHDGIAKFKDDPAIEVFLLHARAHSSGLNLVNASHVFLCEPLLNTALELQAIARVDRIGQQHETTVWLYLVSGTVEESVYNLSVQRRMEHMGRRAETATSPAATGEATPELLVASIEEANTLELEHAALSRLMSKDKSAGEMVDKGDLWQCLFGHVSRDGGIVPERDGRMQEQAVMSYLAAEAGDKRRLESRRDSCTTQDGGNVGKP